MWESGRVGESRSVGRVKQQDYNMTHCLTLLSLHHPPFTTILSSHLHSSLCPTLLVLAHPSHCLYTTLSPILLPLLFPTACSILPVSPPTAPLPFPPSHCPPPQKKEAACPPPTNTLSPLHSPSTHSPTLAALFHMLPSEPCSGTGVGVELVGGEGSVGVGCWPWEDGAVGGW